MVRMRSPVQSWSTAQGIIVITSYSIHYTKLYEKVEQLSQLQDIREFAQAINQEIFDLHNQSGQGKVKVAMDNSAQVQKIQDQISEYEKRKNEFRQIFEQNQKLIKEVEAEIEQEIARNRKAREHFFQLEKEVRDRQNQLSQTKDKFNDIKIRLARIEVLV